MTKGHFQFYRPRASVTLTAAQDAHTYCGHMFPQPLGLGVHARWASSSAYTFSLLCPCKPYIFFFGGGGVGLDLVLDSPSLFLPLKSQ